jgi:microcystin-dependent protein
MDAFIGEIRPFANNYYPDGWLPCEGKTAPLQQYKLLYSIIGTLYGPTDGSTYFTLPDLRGAATVGVGQSPYGGAMYHALGKSAGSETVALDRNTLAVHSHEFNGVTGGLPAARLSTADNGTSYLSGFLYWPTPGGSPSGAPGYLDQSQAPVVLRADTITPAGGNSQGITDPHENMPPFLAIGYFICAISDYYPPRP